MGQRGPSPKPTALRVLQGNAGKVRINRDEPKPKAAPQISPPPNWLDEFARELWNRLRPQLPWLGETDLETLALYCVAYSRVRESEIMISAGGLMDAMETSEQEFEEEDAPKKKSKKRKQKAKKQRATLYVQQNPYISISRTYQKMMRGYAQELGLTPAARTRIQIDAPAKQKTQAAGGFFGG